MMQEFPVTDEYSAALCLDKVAAMWRNVCDYTIYIPSFRFVILYGYF